MKDSLVGQNTLKRRYMKKHAKKTCACGTIFSKTIKSELDHINGINNDNRLENLELRCPNCHRACATSCVGNKGAREAAILEQRMNKNIDKFFEITND